MSVFKNLSEAILEVNEHLLEFRVVNAFITKADDESPYCPMYVLTGPGNFGVEFAGILKDSPYEVIAVFAIIR